MVNVLDIMARERRRRLVHDKLVTWETVAKRSEELMLTSGGAGGDSEEWPGKAVPRDNGWQEDSLMLNIFIF